MRLSKSKIKELVGEIEEFLRKNELLNDVCIYFNNKRHYWHYDSNTEDFRMKEDNGISPLDYFEYAAHKHILSMSFEGAFYDVMNGYTGWHFKKQDEFYHLLDKYNLYYELGNAWNLTCFPTDDNMEIEYTDYTKDVKPEPEYLYLGKENLLPELKNIMLAWHELSEDTGDRGGCVIGAYMKFDYMGKTYMMAPCSPWQGENSWTPHIDTVKALLNDIGAENIHYNYGRLD